ncbi:MAG TPA: S1 RNA-binding domain-containing protein [Promineifilum sp.]|nr:S1 RNA-binding domain-containing protein [Promineifilum sp.]
MSDESMNSLEDLLDQHDYDMPQPGDIRVGVIVANTPQGLIIDLGLKRDGIVPQSDLAKLEPEERDALKVNDEVPVYVVQTEEPETLVVSIHLARLNQDWIEAEALLVSGQIVEGEVIGYNKGGVIVPYGRIRGFVPISHLSDVTPGMGERRRQQRLARLRGEMIGVKIIEVDRQRHRLVMSQREAQKEWEEKKRGELMETLQPGEIRTGRISGMREFGAFVDLGGADGLVHISELSWHRIDHPREVVKLGDEVEVYVLGVDQESGRISLSRKKLLPNPWDSVAQRYTQNQLIEGKVTRILDYGAFAEIEPGVEGLLHVSQLSRNPVEDPRAVVKEGEVHLLRIVSIDQKRQRIGLSLKAVTPTEQIEWMAQKELAEALRREEEEAAAAARGPVHHAEETAETAETGAEAVEAVESAAEETVAETSEAIETTVEELPETGAEAIEEVAETTDSTDSTMEEAADAVEASAEQAEEAAAETVDTVEETSEQAVDEAREVVEEGTDAVGDAAEETGEAAESLIEWVQDAASDAVEAVEDAVSAVVERIESVVEGDGDSRVPDESEGKSAA